MDKRGPCHLFILLNANALIGCSKPVSYPSRVVVLVGGCSFLQRAYLRQPPSQASCKGVLRVCIAYSRVANLAIGLSTRAACLRWALCRVGCADSVASRPVTTRCAESAVMPHRDLLLHPQSWSAVHHSTTDILWCVVSAVRCCDWIAAPLMPVRSLQHGPTALQMTKARGGPEMTEFVQGLGFQYVHTTHTHVGACAHNHTGTRAQAHAHTSNVIPRTLQ